jgi:hypothetical protein
MKECARAFGGNCKKNNSEVEKISWWRGGRFCYNEPEFNRRRVMCSEKKELW